MLAAAQPAQEPASVPTDLLARHRRFVLGDRPLDAFGDLELRGAMVHAQGEIPWRAWLRRHPFAWREELRLPGGQRLVMVANAERAWRLEADGRGTPMQGKSAVEFLAHAFFDGLGYLERQELESRAAPMGRGRLERQPELPADLPGEVRADLFAVGTPVGTAWQVFFDAEDGRLHGLIDRSIGLGTWIRYGRWRTFDGLTVPTLRVQGSIGVPALGVLRIEDVAVRRNVDAKLFAGDPLPVPASWSLASPIAIVPGPTPGSAHLVLPRVVVHSAAGQHAAPALLDTGAEFIAVDPPAAARLRLVPLATAETVGNLGSLTSRHVWIDEVEVGKAPFVQVLGLVTPFPPLPALATGEQAAMVLGGAHLLRGSPVLDLRREELWLRARPVTPLAELPERAGTDQVGKRPAPRIAPLRRCGPGRHAIEVDVKVDGRRLTAMVDTGCSELLMISPRGLRRLGLPLTRQAWIERGALPLAVAGAGGISGDMLLVRIDRLDLAGLAFEQPWVLVSPPAGPSGHDPPFEALLGTGALLPLERVGIDEQRMLLELEPRGDLPRDSDGTVTVPAPGPFLGLLLAVAGGLPTVSAVVPSSSAAAAGVLPGDVLLAIAGESCRDLTLPVLQRRLWIHPGQSLSLRLRRGTGEVEVVLP